MTTTIGVVRETTPGERRVALVPDVVARLRGAGMEVLIDAGAGAGAKFSDGAYADAGAAVTTAGEVYERPTCWPACRHRTARRCTPAR
jgi:NAD(P) transhydrogenase subunit alpha